jgi:hypothetical protein
VWAVFRWFWILSSDELLGTEKNQGKLMWKIFALAELLSASEEKNY